MFQPQHLTSEENVTLLGVKEFQQKFWAQFVKATFPGMESANTTDINGFDWMLIILNQKDPGKYNYINYLISVNIVCSI